MCLLLHLSVSFYFVFVFYKIGDLVFLCKVREILRQKEIFHFELLLLDVE
nr:MAG TPA: hypothetical protein [Caudoviricetes sp.]